MPDQKLKELTVLATYEVAKAIAKQQPEVEHKIQGRLLKARSVVNSGTLYLMD